MFFVWKKQDMVKTLGEMHFSLEWFLRLYSYIKKKIWLKKIVRIKKYSIGFA